MVAAASQVEWDAALYGVGTGAFLLLFLLWALSLRHGADGVPLLEWDVLPARLILVLHCFVAGSVAALAAALGNSVEYTDHPVPESVRWLMCGSLGVYLAIAGVAAASSGRGRARRCCGWGLPRRSCWWRGRWPGRPPPYNWCGCWCWRPRGRGW